MVKVYDTNIKTYDTDISIIKDGIESGLISVDNGEHLLDGIEILKLISQ